MKLLIAVGAVGFLDAAGVKPILRCAIFAVAGFLSQRTFNDRSRTLNGSTRPCRANQRKLHYDQYGMLILLYMFNPMVTSLRAIQQASELGKVQKKLGCKRTSLGSLSEASRLFDSQRLQAIISELGDQASSIGTHKKLRGPNRNIADRIPGIVSHARPGG